ncbi:hypothetical protein NMG60_11022556 [Bertholletia excelsa]
MFSMCIISFQRKRNVQHVIQQGKDTWYEKGLMLIFSSIQLGLVTKQIVCILCYRACWLSHMWLPYRKYNFLLEHF